MNYLAAKTTQKMDFFYATHLQAELTTLVDQKEGNKELMIYFDSEGGSDQGCWTAHLGNKCSTVLLGEVEGELVGKGQTLQEALENLASALLDTATNHLGRMMR